MSTVTVSAPGFELIWWVIIGAAMLAAFAMGIIIQRAVNADRKNKSGGTGAPGRANPEFVEFCEPAPPDTEIKRMHLIALFLWDLLDDIDTVSDMAKSNDKAYREAVERIQRRRFHVGSTNGHTVTFCTAAQPAAVSPSKRTDGGGT